MGKSETRSAYRGGAYKKKTCIDPLHSYTTPGFGWQALLKRSKEELELLTEEQKDLYLFFEEAKRGGLSVISDRYAKAENIPGREGYDKSKPTTWLMYLDANNLYGFRDYTSSL